MAYQVTINKSAAKELEDVPAAERAKLTAKIQGLSTEPRPAGCKKLKGTSDTYRIRQGNYRAVYTIDERGEMKVVKIEKVGHRREIYD